MKSLFFFSFICFLLCNASYTELIANGHFTSDASGWAWFNIDGNGGWRGTEGNPGGGFIINDGGALGSDPTLYQSLSNLIIGATYTVSGDYKLAHGVPVNNAFGVQLFGYLWQYYVDGSWRHFSETFIATATTTNITLTGERNGTDTDPIVDNISLVLVDTPEPSTLILSAFALLFIVKKTVGKK